jgi:hypothetical protein
MAAISPKKELVFLGARRPAYVSNIRGNKSQCSKINAAASGLKPPKRNPKEELQAKLLRERPGVLTPKPQTSTQRLP